MKRKPPDSRNALSALRLSLALSLATLIPLLLYGSAPSWWSARGVLVEQGVADDYAPANQGQLKNVAKAAVLEMDAKVQGGAGDALHQLVVSWSTPTSQTNDFAPLNLGQLKSVAKPFYDRLITIGLAAEYPWTNSSSAADDFAVANIGQVKKMFSFELPANDPLYDGDQNGLPDAWERQYFGTTGVDPNADPDGDGTSNLQEYINHTDPTDFFDGMLIGLAITGGGDQRGDPGTLLPVPISVRVSSLYSFGVPDAPVTVMIAQGGARLVVNNAEPDVFSDSLTLRANAYDNDGYPVAQFYVLLASSPDVSVIRASTHGGSQSVSASTTAVAVDSSLGVPTNLTVTVTSTSTAQLTWTVTNPLPTTLQASVDGGKTWITLGTVAAGLTSATVTGLTPGQKTKFRLFSGGTPSGNNSSFQLPDPSNGSPPPPPPPSGGGGASDSADAVPLAAPVMEVDQAEFYYIRVGGYLGMSNLPQWYKGKKIVIVNDFRDSDGTQVAFGSTTQTFTWIPGHQSYGRGGREVTSTTTTGGGAGLLVPYDTVIWTDSVLRMESSGLLFGSTSSKTITLTDPFTDADAETAGADANLEFYGEFYGPDRNRPYDAFFSHGGGHYDIVVTKYRFRVNADPNAVVTWDVQFTPENGGPVQHDFQSWHGDGSTHSPDYLLDPRRLNHGQNGSYRVVLVSAELMIDANRDGAMSFEDPKVHDADGTTGERPYRFWVNDDQDAGSGVSTSEEVTPPQLHDNQDEKIQSVRDCEDLARLWVNIRGLTKPFKAGDIQLVVKFRNVLSGNPAVRGFRAVENSGRGYVTNEGWGVLQASPPFNQALPGTRGSGVATSTAGIYLDRAFWGGIDESNPVINLLFEGVEEGVGELYLEIIKDGEIIASGPGIWLDIKNVETMYDRAKAHPENIAAPYTVPQAFTGPVNVVADPNGHPFAKAWDETGLCVVFVHGWNVSYDEYIGVAQTMFKRLWHQGFKGHFATFRWDTRKSDGMFDAGEYNRSENRAYVYAAALKQWVDRLSETYTVNLVAHSMGNIVSGEALRQGMQVRNYVLMEAAIPMSCYVPDAARLQRLEDKDRDYPTPDYDRNPTTNELTLGYRGYLALVAANLVNFYNEDDWALATGTTEIVPGLPHAETNWEKNQIDYKPDGGIPGPIHAGTWRYFHDSSIPPTLPLRQRASVDSTVTRYVTDSWEMKAFVARARTKAVGAFPNGDAYFTKNVNLNVAPYNFGRERPDHSGQFTRDIQKVDALYKSVLDAIKQ